MKFMKFNMEKIKRWKCSCIKNGLCRSFQSDRDWNDIFHITWIPFFVTFTVGLEMWRPKRHWVHNRMEVLINWSRQEMLTNVLYGKYASFGVGK